MAVENALLRARAFFRGNTLCILFFRKVNDNFRLYINCLRPVRFWSSLRIQRDSSIIGHIPCADHCNSSCCCSIKATAVWFCYSTSVVSMRKKTLMGASYYWTLFYYCVSTNTDFTTEEDKRQMSFEFLSIKKQLTPLFICHSNTEIC